MLEPIKYTTISSICVRDIVFYEKNNVENLIQFCKLNHISYLPGKDRQSCYKLNENTFELIEKIPEELICYPQDLIFSHSTIKKFTNGNHDEVMFVMEDGFIKGVVHIVDYNNNDLYVELFRLLLKFEKNIRQLLEKYGKKNEDVLNYFESESLNSSFFLEKVEYYKSESGKARILNSNIFEAFYLRDLLLFCFYSNILNKRDVNLNKITAIRNWVAHSREVIYINPDTKHPIYNIKGLKEFVENVQSLFKAFDHVEMKILNDRKY